MRAVCFDLDGVLIDTMPLHVRAWQASARRFGCRASSRDIYAWEGEPGLRTASRLLGRRGPIARRLLREKETRFQRLARTVRLNPPLRQLVLQLVRRGIPVALVTGTSSREVQRILPPQFLSRFDAIVTGDIVRHGKPHPEPYRRALRLLRRAPREAIVVENAPYGIRSAQQAGVGVVIALASSLPKRFLAEADVIVSCASQLHRLLRRLTGLESGRYNDANTSRQEGCMSKLRHRRHTAAMVVGCVVLLLTTAPAAYAQDPIHKMGRGVVNVLTSWIEVPKQIHRGRQDENPFTGFGKGVLRGAGLTVLRVGVGAYEAVTFAFAYPKGFASPYEPMQLPDYAWE